MTHHHTFTRPNGTVITVEYSVSGRNSPPTYSPMYGADGGDCAEFCILKAWEEATGKDIELPDDERETYEDHLSETIDPDDLYLDSMYD